MTYDDFEKIFLESYGTNENYLEAFGGEVTQEDEGTGIDKNGLLTVTFSRAIQYPDALMKPFDKIYKEMVPDLQPSDEDYDLIQKQYDSYLVILENETREN